MTVYDNLVRNALAELADATFQERVWSGRDDTVMSSFDECGEMLFDDSGLGEALDKGAVYGAGLDQQLRALSTVMSGVDSKQPFEHLAIDPRIAECRRLAAEILRHLPDTDPTTHS